MKFLIVALLFVSQVSLAQGQKLSRERFRAIIRVMQTHFASYAARDGRILEFYTDYNSETSEGLARRWETDQVHVYGGLAGIPNVTEDSFALVLCHELGHLYGGEPFSNPYNRMSVEGQGDFWAASECFGKVMPDLPKLIPSKASNEYCRGEEVCARGIDAALVLTAFYADNRRLKHPRLDTPDLSIVSEILKTHPGPQCRLDTMRLGFIRGNRPECWMPRN